VGLGEEDRKGKSREGEKSQRKSITGSGIEQAENLSRNLVAGRGREQEKGQNGEWNNPFRLIGKSVDAPQAAREQRGCNVKGQVEGCGNGKGVSQE
jgi:hypothetical protein